jgi:CRISPR-associated DxTHG motif protein
MRKVYLSFLGRGTYDKEAKQYRYIPSRYELQGRKSKETKFVQAAEIEILGAANFDLLIVVATEVSDKAHFKSLERELKDLGAKVISLITISEDMSAEGQWQWFEKILKHIEFGDEITVDLTHGYRSAPIVFSAAINFLQKARKISLQAVYYGVFEQAKSLGYAPVIDMKDFYIVNEWAEAVSRLVEDADARKMAGVAAVSPGFQTGGLNEPEIIRAMEDLTDTIRNVDVNRVAAKARKALELIEAKRPSSSETGKVLLDLVVDKFAILAIEDPQRYDHAYFMLQLEIVRLLLEHRLYMQAYTVMREFVGSIGMIEVQKGGITSKGGRNRRFRFSGIFVNMLQFNEDQWDFPTQAQNDLGKLRPFYERLKAAGVEILLRGFVSELVCYRNGFDHAWTSKSEAPSDISENGARMLKLLEQSVNKLKDSGLL